ncbi:relaxase/mobilization nuclease domain-containing protein [Nostoc sp. LEGE 12447]|uniref:relaxase/mobilization nuclease domain-containing protein n=1 Tax=Nostoc sp. LEGE 12447 TaxID=1828640 RepID=UPI001D137801|nr:relaxase/mobilization nuclease domain-containing protein [Nostoc sp. LEGE 12447]
MIGNQTKGKSFRGLLDYLENKEESSLIGGNMFGTNTRELAREFRLSRQLNPEAEKVVHHVSLSLSPGEQLDNDTWCEVADKYMNAMGYTANQYAIYRHSDRNHDHIHICASRISLDDGKITRDSWEYVRSEKIIRQLELEYGLQQTLNSKDKLNRAPSVGQQRRVEREQLEYEQGERNTPPQQPIKTQLIELIDRATVDKPTMPQLMERLQLLGIEMRHGLTRNGKSKGISYSWNDQKFSGTSLGPAYTFPGLQKHKEIDYQPERDDERINQILVIPAKPLPIEQLEKFLLLIEHKQQQPQFTPPPEDTVVWQVLHKYLSEKRYIPDYISQGLHNNQLLYMDEQRKILFIKRDLDGEKTGALVWSKPRENHRTVEYDQNTSTQKGWFYLRLGGQPTDKVENVFLCSTPIDAMSAATFLMHKWLGLPPTRTMFMVADDPNNLPMEFLKDTDKVFLMFNNDSQGNSTASAVLELLPHSKKVTTFTPDWSQELEALLLEEQQKRRQQDRGFSL